MWEDYVSLDLSELSMFEIRRECSFFFLREKE